MDNTTNEQIIPENTTSETTESRLEITTNIQQDLHSAGKWSQFLAIMGFIGVGFMVLGGITISIIFAFIPGSEMNIFPFPAFLFGLLYLILAVVYFFPVLYLYRFSESLKMAIHQKKQAHLVNATKNLRAHYKTFGIIVIVILCLYPIFIILMILFGIFSGFQNNAGIPV